MLLNTGEALGTNLAAQFHHERSGVALHHPVQSGTNQVRPQR